VSTLVTTKEGTRPGCVGDRPVSEAVGGHNGCLNFHTTRCYCLTWVSQRVDISGGVWGSVQVWLGLVWRAHSLPASPVIVSPRAER
jgi:hypothetical protein